MNDASPSVPDALAALRRRIDGIMDDHGLSVLEVAVAPQAEGSHEIHIIVAAADSEPNESEEFDAVIRSARDADIERHASEAEAALQRRLEEGEGFL